MDATLPNGLFYFMAYFNGLPFMLVINIIIMLGKMYKLVILPIFPLDPMKCPKRYPKHRENSYFSGLGGVFSGGPKQRKIAKLIFIQPLNFNSKPV